MPKLAGDSLLSYARCLQKLFFRQPPLISFFVPIVLLTFTALKIFFNFMVLIIYESSVLGMVCFCEKHKNVICEEVKTFLMSWV
jgi:uncharacterized membrane protein (DUF485 family)